MSASDQTAQESQRIAYASIVWAELSHNRIAMVGLGTVGTFFFLAIYAPLLSLDQPLIWIDDDGARFPWIAALFNRLLFENAVDLFFNLLMVLSPAYLLVYLGLSRRHGASFGRVRGRWLRRMAALHLILFAAFQIESHYDVAYAYSKYGIQWEKPLLNVKPNIWRVRFFNAMDTLILDTFEATVTPEAALAAPEDLADSAERILDVLETLR